MNVCIRGFSVPHNKRLLLLFRCVYLPTPPGLLSYLLGVYNTFSQYPPVVGDLEDKTGAPAGNVNKHNETITTIFCYGLQKSPLYNTLL